MRVDALATPSLVLDEARLSVNAARMRARAQQLGVSLRPHLKTAKCVEVARVALGSDDGPITVATLREAEFFAAAGFTDITVAAVLPPQKLDRAAALGARLTILVDSEAMARAVARHPANLSALVEIDCGEHRTGVPPTQAPALAHILAGRFAGVLTHAGHAYHCRAVPEVVKVAEAERAAVVHAAELCRAAGHPVSTVSVGSTPTATHATDLTGVTEMRPGVYLLADLFQAGIHSCTVHDIAATVLTTVISVRRDGVWVDAGGLALSKDRSTASLPHDQGYGQVADEGGRVLHGLTVTSVHQEHGEIRCSTGAMPPLSVGDRLRILPNHICMTAAAYDRFHVVHGSRVTGEWLRCTGW